MAATIPTGDNAAMNAAGSARDPVEVLADEFVQRRRRGERPTVAEYAERFPQLADEIRNVFPALLALEQAGASRNGGPSAGSGLPLDAAPPPALGDYRILREIGRGAMGVVYEAEQQSLDRRVALKILPWHATGSNIAVERFRREARAAARLHHTNIVPVFDVGEEGRVCYYAMQYIPGQPLDRVLTELRRSRRPGGAEEAGGQESGVKSQESEVTSQKHQETGRLAQGSTVEEAARHDGSRWLLESSHGHYFRNVAHIGQQVADALAYAHSRGIIHRDIKPSNLLLDASGVVWVTDFGLAKTDDAAITRTGDILGTLRYMAPERFRGECDARADVYSLGATLYELVTLRPAHDATDSADLIARICNSDPPRPRALDPKVPRDLELIVLKALDRDLHARYASAASLAEDLRRFLNDEPILGRAPPLSERFTRWARRNRTLAAVMTTIAVLLVAVAAASTIVSASFQSLASQERAARIETTTRLYQSLVREAEATRLARREGYREEVWSLLDRARQLDTPAVNRDELRHEAVQSLGDFVGLPPTVISGFPAAARAMAFSDDGVVAIGLDDGTIRWHAADSGELLAEQQAHFAPVGKLAYLADTASLYSADSRGVVKSWQRGEERAWQVELVADVAAPLLHLVPVREGQLMAAYRRYADQSEIVVDNLLQRRAVTVDPRAEISATAISRGGDQLAVACHNELLLYSARTGDLLERTTTDLGPILGLAFSPDGRLVFCGCDQGLVVYDLPELRQQTFMRSGDVPLGTFTPDGTQLVFAGTNRRVTLWNFRGNRELAVLSHPGWQELHTVVLTADGRRMATADGVTVRIWDLAGGGERRVLAGHAAGVTAVAYSRDPQRLASASKDRTIAVWDAATGERLAIAALPAAVQAIALDPRAMLAAAGDRDGTLRLYDARSLHTVAEISHSLGAIQSVSFSPSGDRLVAGGQRGMAMWAVHRRGAVEGDAEELLPEDVWLELLFEDASGVVADLQFGSSGALLAWRDADDRPQALEWSERVRWPLSAPQMLRGEQSLAFNVGGRELLLIDRNGTLLGWNVASDEKARGIGRPGDFAGGPIAAHPGGHWLAAAKTPLQLAVWNLATREAVLTLREERAAISAAAWSTDGRQLAVGTQDGGLALWNLAAIRAQLATLDLDWADEHAVHGEVAAPAGTLLEALSAAIEQEPQNARLLARRGQILAQRGEADRALADFTTVLDRHGDDKEGLLGRGQLHARQGRYAEAAADVRRAVSLQPADLENWLAAAVLLARANEAREYREHCRQMIARFSDTAETAALERVVLSCLLLPEVVSPRELPLSRLETSLAGASVSPLVRCRGWITLALAAVRSGDFDRALSNIRRAQQESVHGQTLPLQALSFCVLALTQSELGQRPAARSSLEAAGDFFRTLPPTTEQGVGYAFNERAVVEVLQAEARRRLDR